MSPPPIFCAIDTPDLARAKDIANALSGHSIGLKLGLEFFCAQGIQGVASIKDAYPDTPIFLDLKWHDIPNTVASALRPLVKLQLGYVNLHASGGAAMMTAAAEALAEQAAKDNVTAPKLLAVTVLTSLDDAALAEVGQESNTASQVERLARLTKACGLAGVVCSGHEIAPIRKAVGADFVLMVPGIRPADANVQDQKRVMTPRDAIAAGATHLVIGRPITGAADPAAAAAAILSDLTQEAAA
jgi:orotidine-5'-phosphate decarboxylase